MSQMPSAMRETMNREDGSNRRRWMSHIRRIEAAAAEFRIEALLPSLAAASQSLRDGALIDVALVGRFKAGKSSFINAIIQRDLMPVGVLPVTAIVTRLSYGERERAIVQYADGRMSEIPLADLARFVTEKGNPRNAAGVFMVDVELPSLGAYPGLRFVDTPGLGSVFAHNSKTALDWLPRIGAAFLAVSVDHPFSEEDAELLAELGAHSPAISILLTKADHLSPADLDELRDFVRERCADGDGAIQVFPYSILKGFESYRQPVDEYLRDLSARHRDEFDRIIRHKIRSAARECRDCLGLALAAARAANEKKQALLRQLQKERSELDATNAEIRSLVSRLQSRLHNDALDEFLAHKASATAALRRRFDVESASWKGHLGQITQQFEHWLRDALEAELEPLAHAIGPELAQRCLGDARTGFSRIARAFQDRLGKSIEESLGIRFTGAAFEADAAPPARPDLDIGRIFDSHIDLLWFLVPMRLFRPLVIRHFRRQIPWEAEKNLHRIAAQWREAIDAALGQFAIRTHDYIMENLNAIEALAASPEGRQAAIEQALADMNQIEAIESNNGAET